MFTQIKCIYFLTIYEAYQASEDPSFSFFFFFF